MGTRQGNAEYKERYEEYLTSEDWEEKRSIAYKAAEYRCATCGEKKKLHAHHLFYRNLHDVDPITELLVLCEDCHAIAHHVNTKNKSRYEAIQRITKHLKMRRKQKRLVLATKNRVSKAQRKKNSWFEWIEANKYQDGNEYWVVDVEDLKAFLQL